VVWIRHDVMSAAGAEDSTSGEAARSAEHLDDDDEEEDAHSLSAPKLVQLYLVAHRDGKVDWMQAEAALAQSSPPTGSSAAGATAAAAAAAALAPACCSFLVVGGRAGTPVLVTRYWGPSEVEELTRQRRSNSRVDGTDDDDSNSEEEGGSAARGERRSGSSGSSSSSSSGGVGRAASSLATPSVTRLGLGNSLAAGGAARGGGRGIRPPPGFGLVPIAYAERALECPIVKPGESGSLRQCRVPGLLAAPKDGPAGGAAGGLHSATVFEAAMGPFPTGGDTLLLHCTGWGASAACSTSAM
jgi:hypothetical protein